MRGSVEFDDPSTVERGEVGDEVSQNNLPAKAESRDRLAPKIPPEAMFAAGSIALQPAGARPIASVSRGRPCSVGPGRS
jgi:hypothetical protein